MRKVPDRKRTKRTTRAGVVARRRARQRPPRRSPRDSHIGSCGLQSSHHRCWGSVTGFLRRKHGLPTPGAVRSARDAVRRRPARRQPPSSGSLPPTADRGRETYNGPACGRQTNRRPRVQRRGPNQRRPFVKPRINYLTVAPEAIKAMSALDVYVRHGGLERRRSPQR
jgi:hypothetical protein